MSRASQVDRWKRQSLRRTTGRASSVLEPARADASRGEKPEAFSGKNDETFNKFDAKTWKETVRNLDQVMKDWEHAVESAADAKLQKEASAIAHIGAHNAYHIGRMIFVRKLGGNWNPEKGVK